MARNGQVGQASNVPAHLPAGSAVANMSLLGYDPVAHFTGRAPLEAAAQGIELGPADWAIRCNLVTVQDQVMRDFTADHISTAEARQLLDDAQQIAGAGPLAIPRGRQLSQLVALSRTTATGAVYQRNPHHAAARLDRQVGGRRLSPRSRQRSC